MSRGLEYCILLFVRGNVLLYWVCSRVTVATLDTSRRDCYEPAPLVSRHPIPSLPWPRTPSAQTAPTSGPPPSPPIGRPVLSQSPSRRMPETQSRSTTPTRLNSRTLATMLLNASVLSPSILFFSFPLTGSTHPVPRTTRFVQTVSRPYRCTIGFGLVKRLCGGRLRFVWVQSRV